MTLSRLLGWGHTQDLPNAVDQGNGAKKDPTTTTTTIPYPSEEVCGLMASGSTALCEAKGNLVSHAHPDCGSHLLCRPHSSFLFQWREPPSELGGEETRSRPCWKSFLFFMCFAGFSVVDLAGPITIVGVGPSVLAVLQQTSLPDLEAD